MKKLLPVVMVVALLGGCAAFGPSPENPELVTAAEEARSAVEEAQDVGAPETHEEDFKTLRDRFNELREQQESSPAMALVEEYRDVEEGGYRTAIRSLQTQLDEKESSFKDLQGRVEKLRSKLENRVGTLEDRTESLEKQNRKLKDENQKLQETVQQQEKLRKQLSELRQERDSLRTEIRNLETERSELQSRLDDRQDTIAGLRDELENREEKLRSLRDENKAIQDELDTNLREGDVRTENQRVYIALESKILFGLGNVHVQEDIKEDLSAIADTLKDYPDRRILVEGHTDDLPLKDELKEKYGSNWELSGQRAVNVLKYLVYSQEVNPERIGAVAYGKFQPRVPNTSTENRAKNRRVEIVLLPPELPMETQSLTETE